MIAAAITSHLPPGWTLSNLIALDDCWEAIITDGEYVAVATGETIEEALTAAGAKALVGNVVGRLFTPRYLDEPKPPSLATLLGLPKAAPVNRRI